MHRWEQNKAEWNLTNDDKNIELPDFEMQEKLKRRR